MRASWEASQRELDVLRRQASERRSSLAVAQAKMTQVRTNARRTGEQLKQLQAELATWKTAYEPLVTNENGRRIAASESHFQLAASVLKRDRPTSEAVASWEESLAILVGPLNAEAGEAESDVLLSAQHVAEIEALGSEVRKSLAQLQSDRTLIDAVIKETASLEVGDLTITEALKAREVEEAKLVQQRLESEKKTAVDAQVAAIAAAEAERIKAETAVKQQEIANDRARLGAKLSKLEAERLEIKEREIRELQRKQQEKEFQAALPDIRRYLIAFLAEGMQSRGPSPGAGPMSFSLIEGAGALTRDETGRQNLAHVVGNGGRSTGPLPRFRGGMTEAQQQACDRAQQLLAKFGPLMVEKGMLAK